MPSTAGIFFFSRFAPGLILTSEPFTPTNRLAFLPGRRKLRRRAGVAAEARDARENGHGTDASSMARMKIQVPVPLDAADKGFLFRRDRGVGVPVDAVHEQVR